MACGECNVFAVSVLPSVHRWGGGGVARAWTLFGWVESFIFPWCDHFAWPEMCKSPLAAILIKTSHLNLSSISPLGMIAFWLSISPGKSTFWLSSPSRHEHFLAQYPLPLLAGMSTFFTAQVCNRYLKATFTFLWITKWTIFCYSVHVSTFPFSPCGVDQW